MKKFLLQMKFFLIAWINASYNLFPSYLSRFYLRIFGIKFGRKSCIHRGCKFFHIGKIVAGDNVIINFGCYLDNRRGIIIGNNVDLAHNVKIYTLGHNINSPKFEAVGKPVVIEDNVFVFSNAMIMPGVTIHEGAIVLPGAVVTKDVEPFKVVGGNPAKVVKERCREIDYKCFYPYIFGL